MTLRSLFHALACVATLAPLTASALTFARPSPGKAYNALMDHGKAPLFTIALAFRQAVESNTALLDLQRAPRDKGDQSEKTMAPSYVLTGT